MYEFIKRLFGMWYVRYVLYFRWDVNLYVYFISLSLNNGKIWFFKRCIMNDFFWESILLWYRWCDI